LLIAIFKQVHDKCEKIDYKGVAMVEKVLRLVFLCLVFLCGAIVGGINTPKFIAYAFNHHHEIGIEEHTSPKAPKHIKKTRRLIRSLV